MAPAARRKCDYPGCTSGGPDENGVLQPYQTSEDNVRREEVVADLDKHCEMAHLLALRQQENATKARQAEAEVIDAQARKIHEETQKLIAQNAATQSSREVSPSSRDTTETTSSSIRREQKDKRDSLPRPTIEENSSVTDWTFFKSQWKRYVAATSQTDPQQIHHMWAACSKQLQRALHMGGADNITDPRTLLENIRLLAVKRKNNLVHIVEFQRMGQNSDETITQFSTRL